MKIKVFFILMAAGLIALAFYKKGESDSSKSSHIKQKYIPKARTIAKKLETEKRVAQKEDKDSPLFKDNPINDERLKKILEQMDQDSLEISNAWNEFREQIYFDIGLKRADVSHIDQILKEYDEVLIELIQDQLQNSTNEELNEEYNKTYNDILVERDNVILNFVGEQRFTYMIKQRETFNSLFNVEFKKKSREASYIEINRW